MFVTTATPAAADEFVPGAALEWTLERNIPASVESDENFNVEITFRNNGDVNLTGNKRATIEISSGGSELGNMRLEDLRINGTQRVVFRVSIDDDGNYELTLNAYNGGIVELYDNTGRKNFKIADIKVETVEDPINFIPIIAIIAVVAVIGIVMSIMKGKKKKAEEEKRLADEARRQEMIRKKEAEIAEKIKVRHVAGKHPRDYYNLRRTKYANLKPSGLTRSGLTILSRVKSKAEIEAERIVCPKCGTDLKEVGDECPRCSASEKMEAVRHDIRSYKSQAEADFTDAEALLRKAEHRLNWSDFAMALDLVTKAEERMEEIWEATEKGEAVESRVVEYAEAEGPSLESKVIGLEGEDAGAHAALAAEAIAADEARSSEEPKGKPCPECDNAMDGDECLFCSFHDNLDAAWAIIEKAELDGADMSEPKDLCRQANSAKERDADDLAIRYLRRATRMADETYHSHAQSKTEGIIGFTETLVMQVKTMGEDVSMAEQMLEKATSTLETGDYETARSLANKADGYLKQMKEDSYRKRVSELMPGVEAGAASNAEVQTLLAKAKKLVDAGEFEGAADLLELANDKL
jgi:hypothetical protein